MLRFIPYGNVQRWQNELLKCSEQLCCDRYIASLFPLSRGLRSAHICHTNLWCNDTLIHFIAGNIGRWSIHAGSLQNFYSLLLILLQLKRLRRNFPGTTGLIVPFASHATQKVHWTSVTLWPIKVCESYSGFPMECWSQFTVFLQNSSLLLAREPRPSACTPQPWPTHATHPSLLAKAVQTTESRDSLGTTV